MAFRYRKRHIDSGDVMDPRDWNLNHSNYADEFNGYLDRDNFPADFVTQTMMEENCCNKFFRAQSTNSYTHFAETSVAWQSGSQKSAGSDVKFSQLEIEAQSDALLVCEWSGVWRWTYDASSSDWNPIPDSTLKRDPTNALCRFRMTVDGITVAESGYSSARRAYDGCYLVGATPVCAGRHVIRVEVQILYIEQNGTMLEEYELMRHGTYFVGEEDFSFQVENRELIVRARYR